MHVGHASAVKKRDHQKFVVGFALSGLLGSRRASMLPLGTLCLGQKVQNISISAIQFSQTVLFQTIQFSMSTQFNKIKNIYFKLFS